MNNDNLTPAQAADFLDISAHTVKKYARLLELRGHIVARNGLNHRIFTGEDLALMQAMGVLNRNKSVTLEHAADIVTSTDTDISAILGRYVTESEPQTADSTEIAVQGAHNMKLLTQIFTQYQTDIAALRNELEQRDQLMLKVQTLINEQLAEQAVTIEELREEVSELRKESEEKPQPSIWARIFGKA